MTGKTKIALWVAAVLTVAILIAGGLSLFFIRPRPPLKPMVLTGVVLVRDSDPRKQIPVSDAEITAGTQNTTLRTTSDASGFFRLTVPPSAGQQQPQTANLQITHAGYFPYALNIATGDQIYLAYLSSAAPKTSLPESRAQLSLANIRVRYSEKASTTNNTGSLVKTFEVNNKGNVPCAAKLPCSPDGKWKASIGSFTVEGEGQEFRNVRLSCIAGPCPFTRIEPQTVIADGKRLAISVLNWSDTATFLLEAEVSQTIVVNVIRQSFPAIFGSSMSFTLPATGEGPSIEAELNGRNIVFPLGPDLIVSWGTCTVKVSADRTKLYRCDLKPGYRFP